MPRPDSRNLNGSSDCRHHPVILKEDYHRYNYIDLSYID